MNDMSATIVAKSDQINAADLIGSPRTITIKEVRIKAGEDQPVTIMIEGDKKAFRPCKGVRRLLVRVWGPDASKYIGESMTLFCDPSVTWAGKEEGGIRISHMTGLSEKVVEFMRTSRAATKPYTIMPLTGDAPRNNTKQTAEQWADEQAGAARACASLDSLSDLMAKGARPMDKLQSAKPDLWTAVNAAYAEARSALEPEGKPDADMGEGFGDFADSDDDQ